MTTACLGFLGAAAEETELLETLAALAEEVLHLKNAFEMRLTCLEGRV